MIPTWFVVLTDIFLTFLSIVLGLMLRLEIIYVGYFIQQIWPFIIFAILLRPITFFVFGIYRRLWRYATTRDYFSIAVSILAGSAILSVVTLLWLYPQVMTTFPRSLLIIEAMLSLILLGGLRVGLRVVERYPGDIDWKKIELPEPKRTLIVGAGSAAEHLIQELSANPQLGFLPVALLDDDSKKIDHKMKGLPVHGPLVRLPEIIRDLEIGEVIIAIPSAPAQTIQNLTATCQTLEIPFSTMPSFGSFLDTSTNIAPRFRIPMSMPDITGKEIQAVVRVMQSRNLSIGSQTLALEELVADLADASFAVAVANGTSALHLSMVATGVGPGDEVITTPFSFIASANCILYEGSTPVFVDIEPETLNIDPTKIEAAITERTRAIIPVHLFGQPADMDPILDIAERYDLLVIEDAAEAVGAEYKGHKVGTMGKAGVFAFYPNKQVTTGEGAILVTNDEDWAHLFRSLRNQGRDRFDEWLHHSRLGYNYRMSELNAAVGVVQMKRLDMLLRKREAVAHDYNEILKQQDNIMPLQISPDTTRMSWFVYSVRLPPRIDRNLVMKLLAEQGIPSRPYFSAIHLQPLYRDRFGFKEGDFPEAEKAAQALLALPFHTNMNADEIKLVCEALIEAVNGAHRSIDGTLIEENKTTLHVA